MLKQVIITNYRGESVVYRIADCQINTYDDPNWVPPESSGLIITEISGLGPVKANINMTELTTTDGGIYNSARLTSRNIVIKALFVHATSIEEARLLSYKYFPIKKKVTIKVITDNREAQTVGYVESNEPDIFSDKCACQISILCESAFFDAIGNDAEQIIRFSSTIPLFKFPFGNPHLTQKKIKMGEFISKRDNTIVYNGDSETGFILKLHIYGDVTTPITIYNVDSDQKLVIDVTKIPFIPELSSAAPKLINGDEIEISTHIGKKTISLYREAQKYNILNLLDKNSEWFTIACGNNRFVYEAGLEVEEARIELVILVGVIYEGV